MDKIKKTESLQLAELHEHKPCCHCCAKCHPPLNVEEGKCAICPVLGKRCQYGLELESDPNLLLSRVNSNAQKAQEKAHSMSMSPQKSLQFSPMKTSYRRSVVSQHIFIPVMPIVQMVPVQSLQGSQAYIQIPIDNKGFPIGSQSTIVGTEAMVQSQQVIRTNSTNPQSPLKSSKAGINLVSSRRNSIADLSNRKAASVVRQA